jgi:hypothetical protein
MAKPAKEFTGHFSDSGIDCAGNALIFLVEISHLRKGEFASDRFGLAAIGRAVVDDDDFDILVGLTKDALQR